MTLASPARPLLRRRGIDSYDGIESLFAEYAELDAADERRAAVREELIQRCLPLADHIARKFVGRGEHFDDLLQSARVGMLSAVDRYDPSYGASFLAFAIPAIMGEVRRYFRDFTWAVRVPRPLKEIQRSIDLAGERLGQRLSRTPTVAEIAEELDADPALVAQALVARNGYRTCVLEDAGEYAGGYEEPNFRVVEDRMAVQPLLTALPERERRVLVLRYFEYQAQAQIAEQLGISQMQVSRILSRMLNGLHEEALRD